MEGNGVVKLISPQCSILGGFSACINIEFYYFCFNTAS